MSSRKGWLMTFIAVQCPHCHSEQVVKRGKTDSGTQRYLCQNTVCVKGSFLLGSASMLPLLSSPFYAFFLSSLLSLRSRFLSDARVVLTYRRRTHMRRHHHHCEAAEIRDRPCHHPGLNTRSSRSHGLNPLRWRLPLALRPEVSNELLSVRVCAPVTRYFMRLATPAGRPEEATPSP